MFTIYFSDDLKYKIINYNNTSGDPLFAKNNNRLFYF